MNDPPFTDAAIAIVGVGLIGGSLGLAFKRLGIGREIIGISRAETLREARALDVIDSGYEYDAMDDGVKRSDIWYFCVRPLCVFWNSCPRWCKRLRRVVLLQMWAVPRVRLSHVQSGSRAKGVHFVGGHPNGGVGKERRGRSRSLFV